jgi:hypothetical protein
MVEVFPPRKSITMMTGERRFVILIWVVAKDGELFCLPPSAFRLSRSEKYNA